MTRSAQTTALVLLLAAPTTTLADSGRPDDLIVGGDDRDTIGGPGDPSDDSLSDAGDDIIFGSGECPEVLDGGHSTRPDRVHVDAEHFRPSLPSPVSQDSTGPVVCVWLPAMLGPAA